MPIAAIPPKKILVVKNRALGDSIIGLAAIQYLKKVFPSAQLTYAVPQWILPLYSRIGTAADRIIGFEAKTWGGRWSLFREAWAQSYDVVLELHQSGSTGKIFRALDVFTNTKYFFHNHHIKSGGPVRDQGVIKPIIQRDLDACWSMASELLGKENTGPVPEYLEYPPALATPALEGKAPQLVFGVVATRATKMWPLGHFAQLAKLLPEWEILIPLSTSAVDSAIAEKLHSIGLPENVRILNAPLEELPALINRARGYVGNDTGLKHLAVALGLPTLTFFGPESPLEWHPYHREKHPFFFIQDLPCRTLTGHYCGLSQCEMMVCLKDFSPQAALAIVRGMRLN